jgi:nucleotidyltransferase/DNA polymerase involved in DNA repair
MDCSSGRRKMQTLAKLPKSKPNKNDKITIIDKFSTTKKEGDPPEWDRIAFPS